MDSVKVMFKGPIVYNEKNQFDILIKEVLSKSPSDSSIKATLIKENNTLSSIIMIDSCRIQCIFKSSNKSMPYLVQDLKSQWMTVIEEWRKVRFNKKRRSPLRNKECPV
tara:strand:- start:77 stop:403 length:327 start_codon:yes stop_codon:yes gene_type:complete